jgi:hypothetical protein
MKCLYNPDGEPGGRLTMIIGNGQYYFLFRLTRAIHPTVRLAGNRIVPGKAPLMFSQWFFCLVTKKGLHAFTILFPGSSRLPDPCRMRGSKRSGT